MEASITTRLEQAISEKVFPGAVVGVLSDGKQQVIPVGTMQYDTTAPQLSQDAIFDVASVTKAIPVSCLALSLVDQGELSLDQQVSLILPELKTNYRDEITLRHMLTQTLPFTTSLASLKDQKAEELLRLILNTQFTTAPGERLQYANATSILLGLVLEKTTGKKLDELAKELFFAPLGMKNTTFHPEQLVQERIVPTEVDSWRGRILQGEVHDESASVLKKVILPGSAGLFSTVPDMLIFLTMLLQRGSYEGRQYFSEQMVEQMAENQAKHPEESFGLGWELFQPRYMGHFASEKTIGKTGFTGCVVMLDLGQNRGVVLFSNYHFPKRKKDTAALNNVRREIADIVFS